jgi:alkanesulfonate monooxygenase SsuD/methylene tetrahydromethanopterin reductase-like flavin-dependent oxidoreductase (luciferase family)
MKLSITIASHDLTWSRWKQLTAEIEHLGFAGVFRGDHFGSGAGAVDALISLAYLAEHSRAIHFGTLVSPVTFRDPVILARQAMAINELSGGRMVLGLGAGSSDDEHTMFGYDRGDVNTRMVRLEEGVHVVAQLLRSEAPVTFEGRFFKLREARLLPRPHRPTPILIGGTGPRRTLPLIARYADIWNCEQGQLAIFKERSALLDELLVSAGRKPGDVKRTVFLPTFCWRDAAEMERVADDLRQGFPFFAGKPAREVFEWFAANMAAITGPAESVIEQLRAYETAGCDEAMLWFYPTMSADVLKVLASSVLPRFPTDTGEKS